ncbi:MAG: hypothetical protein AB1546_03680, partial [bacterium]
LIGLIARVFIWSTRPKDLKWTLFPCPESPPEQISYIAREVMTFACLFKHNRKLWYGSFFFHISIAMTLLWFILFILGVNIHPLGVAAPALMIISCAYIILIRIGSREMQVVSSPVDIFNLLLFSGFALTALIALSQTDLPEMREYFLALITFRTAPHPSDCVFFYNIILAEIILIYLPFTKMTHFISKYFAFHKINWEHH